MILLDTDDHYFVTPSRPAMVAALLAHPPQESTDEQLARLAAACLGCDLLDVVVVEE